jgi:hypothetical protein
MKKSVVVGLLLAVAVIVFLTSGYFIFNSVTGNVSENSETGAVGVEKDLFSAMLVPNSLSISASIGADSQENFEVKNLNDVPVMISCDFPAFQDLVPSSMCFTYNSEGNFVGNGSVEIKSGESQRFTIVVHPYDGIKIQKNDGLILVDITAGDYSGEVALGASTDETAEQKKRIPVKIIVEE